MSRLLRTTIIGLLAIGGLLALASADEEPAASKPDEPADRAAKAPDEAAPDEVPDGTTSEMLKAVEKLARRPSYTVEDLQRKCQAIIAGTDRILDGKPDEDQAVEAVEWRFSALDALARYEDAAAGQRLQKLVAELKDDPRPGVASVARRYDLDLRSGALSDLSSEKQREFLAEVLAWFETAEVTAGNLDILLATGMALADSGDAETASAAYQRFATLARRSDDAEVRRLARQQFGTMLERLALMGQTLEVSGETLDGQKFGISEYKGKVVLVDFWATWCAPCVAEMPNLRQHYAKYRDRGFEIVGVNVDGNRENVEAFLKETELPWKTLFSDDPRYKDYGHPVAAKYEIAALPTLLLLDRTGKVVSVTAHGPRLTRWLDKLLGPAGAEASEAAPGK